ncbi:MAG TPA: AraC family transcriptional regulator, partial [bacterium]
LEVQYGGPHVRDRFVGQCFKEVQKKKKTVCGERLGFKDLFVPILWKGRLLGYLQAGAFAEKEITMEALVKCWKEMSGREASSDLPEFREFARAFLGIPVLDGPLFPAFQESLELFAKLLSGTGDEVAIGQRLQQLQRDVFSKRLPHSYWLDWALGRPTSESVPPWHRQMEQWSWTKDEIGLTRVPTTVLTVIPQRSGRPNLDWASEILRIYRFQRKSFLFGRTLPETVGGKLDDYGAAFVTSADPRLPRLAQRKWIEDLSRKIRDFAAKEFGGAVLVGVGETVAPGEPLNTSFRQAVLALHPWRDSEKEVAFFDGSKKEKAPVGFSELRHILDELHKSFATASFSGLEVLKERFLKQAIRLSFQDPHEIRWHFQYALDRIAETVGNRMDLGKKDAGLLREKVDRMLEEAATLQEIVLAFQEALSNLEKQMERPLSIKKDHSLEKAREYMDRHFRESLPIVYLAKMAGVSVSTFSRRFKKATGVGLETYLQNLRLEESRRLLKTGNLPVSQIAKGCGFKATSYFIRLFRKKNGLSPQRYRQKPSSV